MLTILMRNAAQTFCKLFLLLLLFLRFQLYLWIIAEQIVECVSVSLENCTLFRLNCLLVWRNFPFSEIQFPCSFRSRCHLFVGNSVFFLSRIQSVYGCEMRRIRLVFNLNSNEGIARVSVCGCVEYEIIYSVQIHIRTHTRDGRVSEKGEINCDEQQFGIQRTQTRTRTHSHEMNICYSPLFHHTDARVYRNKNTQKGIVRRRCVCVRWLLPLLLPSLRARCVLYLFHVCASFERCSSGWLLPVLFCCNISYNVFLICASCNMRIIHIEMVLSDQHRENNVAHTHTKKKRAQSKGRYGEGERQSAHRYECIRVFEQDVNTKGRSKGRILISVYLCNRVAVIVTFK